MAKRADNIVLQHNQPTIDIAIGLLFLIDLSARLWIARKPAKELASFWGIADILVILSLLVPIWGEGLAFLRVLRLYRVFHSPLTLVQLRTDIPGFQRSEDALRAALNLVIFIFAMTALVYQSGLNETIANYVDASVMGPVQSMGHFQTNAPPKLSASGAWLGGTQKSWRSPPLARSVPFHRL